MHTVRGRMPRALLTAFLLLLLSIRSGSASQDDDAVEISYVMEPFESTDDGWFASSRKRRTLNLTMTPKEDAYVGKSALRVEYNATRMGGSVVDFGWIQPVRPHNCHGATHASVWYKVLRTQGRGTTHSLRLTLMDDSECSASSAAGKANNCAVDPAGGGANLEHYVSRRFVLEGGQTSDDTGNNVTEMMMIPQWREIKIPLEDLRQLPLAGAGNATLIAGNRRLDLERIRGWGISIAVDPPGDNNDDATAASSGGVLLLDQLACVGGGEMLGAPFYTGNINATWRDAVEQGAWTPAFYRSNLSESLTSIDLRDDGVLSVDYAVQMTETWGGYTSLNHMATGPAYYNLTNAKSLLLGYNVRRTASPPSRTHLRLILTDGKECERYCVSDDLRELWYSFHYILDDDEGSGEIKIPLNGSTEPNVSPFWLTGWSGAIGNSRMDVANIKGYTLEFSMDSQGNVTSTASGALDLFDLRASSQESVYLQHGGGDASSRSVVEPDLYIRESLSTFRRKEFLGGTQCFEACDEDPTCLYALSTGKHCYLAPYVEPSAIGILNTEITQSRYTSFWMDDASKRGDYCAKCQCSEAERTIDCRGRNLVVVPKTLGGASWTPRVLDLRQNPRLVLLGAGALKEIGAGLEELWLPANMSHVSRGAIDDLPSTLTIRWEEDDEDSAGTNHSDIESSSRRGGHHLFNAIADPSDAFGDVCCARGQHVSAAGGLTFCNMTTVRPGVDATYMPFIQLLDANPSKELRPSSSFMFEAAESVEKCAEYCSVLVNECKYFSYDDRVTNAEPICYLLEDGGTGPFEQCCEPGHYADNASTIPGWVSGVPPRTRHTVENARVLMEPKNLVASTDNDFQTQFTLSLGSRPIRGAVWVEPTLVTFMSDFNVSFSPSRVALYDEDSTVTITVTVSTLDRSFSSMTLVVNNIVTSCDAAFMSRTEAVAREETTMYIKVVAPPDPGEARSHLIAAFVSLGVLAVLAVGLLLCSEWRRSKMDSVWKVKMNELSFGDRPVVIGRGTFGQVLLADFRGTQVAVKRVIPSRTRKGQQMASKTIDSDFSAHDSSIEETDSSEGNDDTKQSHTTSTMSVLQEANVGMMSQAHNAKSLGSSGEAGVHWRKLKSDFVKEMRMLSKLRHPCITTVMGAVINSKVDYLILEYMDHGSLHSILHNDTVVIEPEVILPILRDITQGMTFLHATQPHALVHGDLKAANILVDRKFRAKVADFGLSQKRRLTGGTTSGTPYWMAPELLRKETTNTTASDVYSFGIILYEAYSRRDPYEGENPQEVLKLVADEAVNHRPPVPKDCPLQVQSIMKDCQLGDPQQRPTFHELDQRFKRVDVKQASPSMQAHRHSKVSLFDIFPRHIAEALRDGKTVEPEHRDMVTIFFSDIVGFTSISSTLKPKKVADLLARLYTKFDELSLNHDVFKVETIGDAYMAVTNLVKDQSADHVRRLVDFAIGCVEAAGSTLIDTEDVARGYVQIRVGLHSGPVCADVVGLRNPRFCLFGDSVNTASRMESNSKPGRIHCSEDSADLLKVQYPEMHVRARGRISVKGKGEMFTYWVNEVQDKRETYKRSSKGSGSSLRRIAEDVCQAEPQECYVDHHQQSSWQLCDLTTTTVLEVDEHEHSMTERTETSRGDNICFVKHPSQADHNMQSESKVGTTATIADDDEEAAQQDLAELGQLSHHSGTSTTTSSDPRLQSLQISLGSVKVHNDNLRALKEKYVDNDENTKHG